MVPTIRLFLYSNTSHVALLTVVYVKGLAPKTFILRLSSFDIGFRFL